MWENGPKLYPEEVYLASPVKRRQEFRHNQRTRRILSLAQWGELRQREWQCIQMLRHPFEQSKTIFYINYTMIDDYCLVENTTMEDIPTALLRTMVGLSSEVNMYSMLNAPCMHAFPSNMKMRAS